MINIHIALISKSINMKYRKALFATNDRKYPYLFLMEDDVTYMLIKADGTLTGDAFDGREDVLKYFPQAEL